MEQDFYSGFRLARHCYGLQQPAAAAKTTTAKLPLAKIQNYPGAPVYFLSPQVYSANYASTKKNTIPVGSSGDTPSFHPIGSNHVFSHSIQILKQSHVWKNKFVEKKSVFTSIYENIAYNYCLTGPESCFKCLAAAIRAAMTFADPC